MEKPDKKKIIRAVVITLATLAILALIFSPFWGMFYNGDRITITLKGTIDGVEVLPDSDHIECKNIYGEIQDVNCSEPGVFSIKGGEEDFERYVFNFSVDHEIIELKLTHLNWWQVDKCQLNYEIDTAANELNYTFISADGNKSYGKADYQDGKYINIDYNTRPSAFH